MVLSESEIEKIRSYVAESNVLLPSLRDDLTDHLCCEVERRICEGKTFQQALDEAISHFQPHDLYKIQMETEFLLQPNKFIMKKALYFTGLASTISMTMGLMFKIMHRPGADQLINYGFMAFMFVFLPVIFAAKLNKAPQLSLAEKSKAIIGIISAVGMLLAIITKIRMQIDLATIFLFCTTIVFCFGFLPLHFYEMYRKAMREAN